VYLEPEISLLELSKVCMFYAVELIGDRFRLLQ
jgi:hypothetical protein